MVLLNQVFPCFHCFRKPLLHTYLEYAIYFFSVEVANGMLFNCHMYKTSTLGCMAKNLTQILTPSDYLLCGLGMFD